MDIEVLKGAMFALKPTMLTGDHVTTEEDSFLSLLKCLVKCQLEEETKQRRMNGIFTGEGD